MPTEKRAYKFPRVSHIIVFVCVAVVWLAFDILMKIVVTDGYPPGSFLGGPYLGLFELRLTYNTGAAWSLFSNSTLLLGVFSILICIAILVYLFVFAPNTSMLGWFSLALVFAGGLGNAINRFMLGYVVDFISLTFIDFPIFNIADIGVTCGVILFAISLLISAFKDDRSSASQTDEDV